MVRIDWQNTRGELCRVARDLVEALAPYEFPEEVERRIRRLRHAIDLHEQTILKYRVNERPLRLEASQDRRAR